MRIKDVITDDKLSVKSQSDYNQISPCYINEN